MFPGQSDQDLPHTLEVVPGQKQEVLFSKVPCQMALQGSFDAVPVMELNFHFLSTSPAVDLSLFNFANLLGENISFSLASPSD